MPPTLRPKGPGPVLTTRRHAPLLLDLTQEDPTEEAPAQGHPQLLCSPENQQP